MDTSIKNQITTLISHIHSHNNPVIKTIHHVINVISTEARLFAIRCGINQATYLPNVNQIFVITDSIHAAKRIFNLLLYPYQIQSISISHKLRKFFKKDNNNFIEFWDCPSNQKWYLHNIIDKETKKFSLLSIFPYKSSWNFNRENKYDNILNSWKMVFQASDNKERYFIELLDDNDLKPVYYNMNYLLICNI